MNIEAGDTVRHKTRPTLSFGGLGFNVIRVDGEKAFCDYFNRENENMQEWFNTNELVFISRAEPSYDGSAKECEYTIKIKLMTQKQIDNLPEYEF